MMYHNLAKEYQIIEEINTGGSDRHFFRCLKGQRNYILIYDKEIADYIQLQKHLLKRDIGVPKIHFYDKQKKFAVVEDLGKDSLYECFLKKEKNIYRLYQEAIKELIKLQIDGFFRAPIRVHYDYEHIRWEQEYFREFFLHQLCKLPVKRLNALDYDFDMLAQKVVEAIKPIKNFLMHRDYQSQNIYIKNGRARIIDFQSARIGPLTYDVAALLRDSYVHISKGMEAKLIDYYLACLANKGIELKRSEFIRTYHLTALQRNMQALGAFANLSLNRNRGYFRKYIPRGVSLLRSGLKDNEFKHLLGAVNYLYEKNIIQQPR